MAATGPTDPPPSDPGGSGSDRWRLGLYAVLGGALLITLIAVVALIRYPVAADAATATAPFVAAIGTITGAYFGIQAGSANQDQTHQAMVDASHRAEKWAALADPTVAAAVYDVPAPSPERPAPPDGPRTAP
ncbi:hypothetical protein EV188_10154 [Actinomycetospora succinea]|uniref:Uncharacterized protein n=1 Tax=Actinomycetospora succinea TaxID=663603 RepID=A0A4R6VQM4_9PSEU|nr:hypothetical protein [Actinomycetospora succinea]TDQ64807.1 hypothetical protein EV188_10154 [Actinomycetospora succinea]